MSLSCMSGPLSLEVQAQEEEPPEHLALKASGAGLQKRHRIGRNRDFTLGGHTQTLTCTRTKGKSCNFLEAWARPTCLWYPKTWPRGKAFKEELTPIFLKYSKNIEERILPNSLYAATLSPWYENQPKISHNKENYRPISLMNIDAKIPNKIPANWMQQYI